MISLVTLAIAACVLTLAITPICRFVCIRFGWVDRPDHRKVHRQPVPRTGGIAIIAGYAGALCLILLPSWWITHDRIAPALRASALVPAILAVFLTGLVDDIVGLKPWMKIAGQTVAASLACYGGVEIHSLAGLSIADTWWHIPLTITWLVGCANAFNLIDGLDGLAAGVGLFAALTAFVSALLNGNLALALVTAPLIGALLGFLPYNFNPASIFMGDCGSLSVGFLLGCFGIIWSQKSATVLGMTAPLVALAVPLLDTSLAIFRRFLGRRPLLGADRRHIHHRLLARGLTTRRVAFVIYAFAGTVAGLSLLLSFSASHFGGAALVAFCCITCAGVHYLKYEEFDTARRILFGGLIRRVIESRLSISHLEHRLQSAGSLEDCWSALLHTSRGFGFSHASLRFHDHQLSANLLPVDPAQCWSILIPLNGSGHLNLLVPFQSPQPPATIHALARSLGAALTDKLGELSSPHPAAASGLDLARLSTAVAAASDVHQAAPASLSAYRSL